MPLPYTGAVLQPHGGGGGVGGGGLDRDVNVNCPPTSEIPPEPQVNSSAIVRYNYESQQSDEISLVKGSKVAVLEKSNDGWWRGMCNGLVGWFPSNYVQEEDGQNEVHTYAPADCTSPLPPGSCLEVVVSLYAFVSQNEEELNFKKGERLEIIEKPANDPEWWRARNCNGEVGLVPKNYVKVVTDDMELGMGPDANTNGPLNTSNPLAGAQQQLANLSLASSATGGGGGAAHGTTTAPDLSNKPWYWGNITRHRCDTLLNERGSDGEYLLRDSETNVST